MRVKGQSMVNIPKKIPFEQACFLHCTAAVALRGLHRAKLKQGERVLV